MQSSRTQHRDVDVDILLLLETPRRLLYDTNETALASLVRASYSPPPHPFPPSKNLPSMSPLQRRRELLARPLLLELGVEPVARVGARHVVAVPRRIPVSFQFVIPLVHQILFSCKNRGCARWASWCVGGRWRHTRRRFRRRDRDLINHVSSIISLAPQFANTELARAPFFPCHEGNDILRPTARSVMKVRRSICNSVSRELFSP